MWTLYFKCKSRVRQSFKSHQKCEKLTLKKLFLIQGLVKVQLGSQKVGLGNKLMSTRGSLFACLFFIGINLIGILNHVKKNSIIFKFKCLLLLFIV